MDFKYLVQGIDTIECSYYMTRLDGCLIDFVDLAMQKDILRIAKSKHGSSIKLGNEEFMLASHGTQRGYPFLIENEVFSIEFGEFNKPNFYVVFRSVGLWHFGAIGLHQRFLEWAVSVGLTPYKSEKISRLDFAFDYQIDEIDFDQDSFISTAKKDNLHRNHRIVQTFRFGIDQIVMRMYNKSDEIEESSHKTWFFKIWNAETNVWRIEWQVRKVLLKFLSIEGFADLNEGLGDLLRKLVKDTSLRIKSEDTNRSRWQLHPLWKDLNLRINQMDANGLLRSFDRQALTQERLMRIKISLYGYIKGVAAHLQFSSNEEKSYIDEVFEYLQNGIMDLHDPLTWQTDIDRRVKKMRLGEW